jgi:HK97 family phage major capsid protein
MLTSIQRKKRIAELVRQIPNDIERKEGPNELEVLKTKIIEANSAKVDALKTEIEKQMAELKLTGISNPMAEKAIDLMGKRIDQLEAELKRPEANLPEYLKQKSVGVQFIESDEFKNFKERGWHRGGTAMKFDDKFNPFFSESNLWEEKTTITSAAVGSSTPGILVPQRLPGIVPKALRRLTIRDLLPSGPTTNNAVEYVKENVFTNAASPTVENNAKPESALTFTITSANVRLIAHWIPASRQILDDMNGLSTFINERLLYGLKLKEETELLNGDNLGDHLNGLITQATAYAGTYLASGDTKIDTLRHYILEANVVDEVVSGIVIHPKTWHDIELIKTEEGGANKGMYIIGEPGASGDVSGMIAVPTLWGLPVVATNSMTAGKALVGAFGTQAKIFDRMQAVIDISTEHASYFTSNLVAIRAEERLALAVFRSTAFVYGSV